MDICIQERMPDEMDYVLNEGYDEEIKQYARQLGLQGQIDLADGYLRKLRRQTLPARLWPRRGAALTRRSLSIAA